MNWLRTHRRTAGWLAGGAAVMVVTGALLSVSFMGASSERSPSKRAGGTSTVVAADTGISHVAVATTSLVPVFDAPGATEARQVLDNPWFVNDDPQAPAPLVFHVESADPGAAAAAGWVEVMLPSRPNGSTGWVRAADVALQTVAFGVVVDLSDHQLTVYQDGEVLFRDTVAIGKPTTPTPLGRSYIRVLLRPPGSGSPYGPYAYGLSGHSEVLNRFMGGDAEIGIHGNNDASVLGQDVSSGCIRMSNAKVTELAGKLPLGTPVLIRQ